MISNRPRLIPEQIFIYVSVIIITEEIYLKIGSLDNRFDGRENKWFLSALRLRCGFG